MYLKCVQCLFPKSLLYIIQNLIIKSHLRKRRLSSLPPPTVTFQYAFIIIISLFWLLTVIQKGKLYIKSTEFMKHLTIMLINNQKSLLLFVFYIIIKYYLATHRYCVRLNRSPTSHSKLLIINCHLRTFFVLFYHEKLSLLYLNSFFSLK